MEQQATAPFFTKTQDMEQVVDVKQHNTDANAVNIACPHLSSSILDVSSTNDANKYMFQEPNPFNLQHESRHSKKRKVSSACIPCKLSRAKCSDTRPCSRCIATSKTDSCADGLQFLKVRAYRQCRVIIPKMLMPSLR